MKAKNKLNLRHFFSITYLLENQKRVYLLAHSLRNEISDCDKSLSGLALDRAPDGFGYVRIRL